MNSEVGHKIQIEVYAIFLVKQDLTKRTEQFMAIKGSHKEAIAYARAMEYPKLCNENIKYGANFKNIATIYSVNQLLIKNIDFNRRDEGRANNNPRWYWNIASVKVIKDKTPLFTYKKASKRKSSTKNNN